MRIFLDANILVSVLNKEYPLFTYAARIISLADNKKFTVFTSPLCLAIAFYFVEKKSGTQLAKQKIKLLSEKNRVHILLQHSSTLLLKENNGINFLLANRKQKQYQQLKCCDSFFVEITSTNVLKFLLHLLFASAQFQIENELIL